MASKKVYVDLDFQSIARVLNLPDATNPQDPVTLQQLNNFLLGRRWKEPVRAAFTANVSLTAPGASADGVSLVNGDRVLLPVQTTGSQNGIYVWNGAATTLVRATDADSAVELQGATFTVMEGATYGDKIYTQTADSITLGTTALVFSAVGGSSVTAGNGLTGTSTISVLLDTASGLIVSGTGLKIDTTVVVRKFYKANAVGATENVTHNLGVTYPEVQLVLLSTGEYIEAKVSSVDANTTKIDYNASQPVGTIGIVIQG